MKSVTFAMVAKEAQAMVKQGSNLWNTFVLFTMSHAKDAFSQGKDDQGKALKAIFKENEEAFKEDKEVNLNTIGAYRSAKSVIVAAARYGVPVLEVNKDGKVVSENPRGKSEVEGAINDLREAEPTIETIKRSFTAIGNKLPKIENKTDAAVVYSLAKKTLEQATEVAERLMKVKSPAKVDEAAEKLVKAQVSTQTLTEAVASAK